MSKAIQIPEELFYDICRYFLLDQEPEDEEELTQAITEGLNTKLEAIARRELYSQYKDTSLTPEQRQEARKAYLDRVCMRDSYRWDSLEPPV